MVKHYFILALIIIIGFALFLIQAWCCSPAGFWYNAIGNIASALLISGTLSLLHRIFLKVDEERKLITIFNISKAIQKSGLSHIETDSTQYHFTDLIKNSEKFFAIMNDGLRWVGNHSPALETRFNRKDTKTEFYLVDPSSDFCKALAIKTDVELEALKLKIIQTISLLESTYNKTQKKGTLHIYLLKNYPTQSIFYTEAKVILTPYQTSSGRNIIPLYEYNYKEDELSIGSYLYKDLERVRNESKLYSENGRRKE